MLKPPPPSGGFPAWPRASVVAVVQLANKATGDKFGFEDEEALVAYGQFAGSPATRDISKIVGFNIFDF